MKIDEKDLEFFILKKRFSSLIKFLSIFHFIIGGIFIITLTGAISGIISIVVGIFLLRLNKEIPNLDEKANLFLKNLFIFFLIYTISLIIAVVLIFTFMILFLIWEGIEGFLQIF